jgi:serine phosphatase RsbU (regulator of sigma subunit)
LGGVWMGIIQNVDHILEENTIPLSRGDLVLLYTDGVTDLRNQEDEMYGRERLVRFITNNGDKSSQEILDLLFEKLSKFGEGRSQFDDITALAIKRK